MKRQFVNGKNRFVNKFAHKKRHIIYRYYFISSMRKNQGKFDVASCKQLPQKKPKFVQLVQKLLTSQHSQDVSAPLNEVKNTFCREIGNFFFEKNLCKLLSEFLRDIHKKIQYFTTFHEIGKKRFLHFCHFVRLLTSPSTIPLKAK